MQVDAVYAARCRVQRCITEELNGWIRNAKQCHRNTFPRTCSLIVNALRSLEGRNKDIKGRQLVSDLGFESAYKYSGYELNDCPTPNSA